MPRQNLGDRPGIRFEDVRARGHGEPPDLIEVRLLTETTALRAVVSLFGLRGHDHGTAPAGPSDCKHCPGPKHFGGLLESFAADGHDTGLFITPMWAPGIQHRGVLEIGAIALGDV